MLKLLKIKLLGITNVNYDLKYMDSNLFFGKFTRKEVQDFFSWYLSKPFKNNGGLEILDYINIAIDRGLIPADEADEMLINSKFVSTLPMDLLEMELKWYDGSLSLLPKFTDFLINKMDGNNRAVLIRLFRSNDINDFLLDKISDKLMEHPIEDIIEPQGFNMDREEILVNKIARSKYTLDEIKRFIIESDIAIPLIVDLFGTLYIDKETEIDAILLLVLERYSEFKFDENKALALVKAGSIYTKFLLHNYRFSKEIRLEIYNHYRDNGREDLLALYSGYLITVEANRIVDSKDADIDLSRLRKNPSEM